MTTTVDVLYFIEHVARELDIACAIKHHAASKHGLRVEIASLAYGLRETCRAWRPRLIAVPYFYSAEDAFVKDVLAAYPGIPVVNLAFEQLFSAANKKYKRPRDEAAKKSVLHLAAGDFFREFLVDAGTAPENVAVVGSLACGLVRPPYRAAYEGAREALAAAHGLDPSLPWLFFPENYAAAFFSPGDLAKRRDGGFSADDLVSYVEFTRQSFAEAMRWCAEAAGTCRYELVIRPRPATPAAEFQGALQAAIGETHATDGLPAHLHVIKHGSVREWMLASEMTVSSYSSTVVEAAAAGRPVCLAAPRPFPPSVLADWNNAAPLVRTREEFLRFLESGGRSADGRPLVRWAEKNLFPLADPIAAATDVLHAVCSGERRVNAPPAPSRDERRRTVWKQQRRRFREAWSLLAKRKSRRPTRGHEHDLFTRDEVAARTARWERILSSKLKTHKVPSQEAA